MASQGTPRNGGSPVLNFCNLGHASQTTVMEGYQGGGEWSCVCVCVRASCVVLCCRSRRLAFVAEVVLVAVPRDENHREGSIGGEQNAESLVGCVQKQI